LSSARAFQYRSAQTATPPSANGNFQTGETGLQTETRCERTTSTFHSTGGLDGPFKFGESMELIPQIEMFNTFNNNNYINSLSIPGNQSSLTAPSLF
jgi:hypothetical protein